MVYVLKATGARVEVEIDGVEREGDADEVADIDAEVIAYAIDMHVIGLNGEVEFTGFFQYVIAEGVVGRGRGVGGVCKICHISLEFEIVDVDGEEHDAESGEDSQDADRSGDAPAGDWVHWESSGSFPAETSSAQMSSE